MLKSSLFLRWVSKGIIRLPCVSCMSSTSICCNNEGKKPPNLQDFPPDRIRNFSIIAHVDHGKSTLADRLLEVTGTIVKQPGNAQVLDKLQVERQRGITVKAQTASMFYWYRQQFWLLNLIDTPGHADFNFEVSRSLAASDGAILLVDANQGVQAQTVANFWLSFERNVKLVPTVNKIDLKEAKPDEVIEEIFTLFELPAEDCLKVSAKMGLGIDELLNALVDRIPPPSGDRTAPLRAFIFDSWYDRFRGVFAFVVVKDGSIEKGQKIRSLTTGRDYEVQQVGIMWPETTPVDRLYAGQVGYVVANMKNVQEATLGDTLVWSSQPNVAKLPGIKPAKPMVFAGLFPLDSGDYTRLKGAVEQLALNDPSVLIEPDSSPALGLGFRIGFLGLLHMEVFSQRLEQEYDENVIMTAPSVPFKAEIKNNEGIRKRFGGKSEVVIVDPGKFPDHPDVEQFYEPIVLATIITPECHMGKVLKLCNERRGVQKSLSYIHSDRILMKFQLPLAEIVVDFHDELKQLSSGYASLDYEDAGWKPADLVKLTILLNGKPIEEFSSVCPRADARLKGKEICAKLVKEIPRQQFDVAIQAANGGKILARETVRALRKDIASKGGKAGNFGSDVRRKNKLLAHQAEGKSRLKLMGTVEVPKETFFNVLRR